MRTRVFDIIVQGRDVRTEPAVERIAMELQHELATGRYRGKLVHVRERFVAAPTPKTESEPRRSGVGRALPTR